MNLIICCGNFDIRQDRRKDMTHFLNLKMQEALSK